MLQSWGGTLSVIDCIYDKPSHTLLGAQNGEKRAFYIIIIIGSANFRIMKVLQNKSKAQRKEVLYIYMRDMNKRKKFSTSIFHCSRWITEIQYFWFEVCVCLASTVEAFEEPSLTVKTGAVSEWFSMFRIFVRGTLEGFCE